MLESVEEKNTLTACVFLHSKERVFLHSKERVFLHSKERVFLQGVDLCWMNMDLRFTRIASSRLPI